MSLSVNAIRGLILLANVLLLGLIMWLCYGTFVTVDQGLYFVDPPRLEKYRVQEISVDKAQQEKANYQAIARVFDRPPPPPEPPKAPPPKDEIPVGDPRKIEILAMNVPVDGHGTGSALINAPLASPREPKYVQSGMNLGELQELKAYDGVRLEEITAEGAVFVTKKGEKVKVPGPRGDKR
ncbi:MAG TPA: hypothetical protein VHF22_05780 [Planctomycetota bacterium]|nr:hypothetical protein [Planctomycetota bacterium]